MPTDWLLWQLADSAFPAGGFAHSGGVEAAFQNGEIRGRNDLNAFVEAALLQSGKGALPFVNEAFSGERSFREIDDICDAFISNHVANRASRLQGRAFLASASRTFAQSDMASLETEMIETNSPGHFAPVWGAIFRRLKVDRRSVLRMFLFVQLRGWISSAVRLGIIGPIEGQGIQNRMASVGEGVLERCAELTIGVAAQTSPLIDLFQGTQDRLYSRLFQS